jgi:hypothetical protein
MRWRRARITLRGSMIIVAILAAFLGFLVVPMLRHIDRQNKRAEYRRVAHSLVGMIDALTTRAPEGVSSAVWTCAVKQTMACQFNVCFASEPAPSAEELYDLREELDRKLLGTVDLKTLEWMWDRYAQMGPAGGHAVRACRPSFDACLSGGGRKYHTAFAAAALG